MTPKEKAEELVIKYFKLLNYEFGDMVYSLGDKQPHQCALIAVDEILISVYKINFYEYPYDYSVEDRKHLEYWQEVKQEINNL